MASFQDRDGQAAASPRRGGRAAPAIDRRGSYHELHCSLGWSAARIAGVCHVSLSSVYRALSRAGGAPPRGAGRSGPRRSGPGPPHLTPSELIYIRKYWGDNEDVRRWLLELELGRA